METIAVYLSVETGRVLVVGLENGGENNNGSYHVDLYHNAIGFTWGDPVKEGDMWSDDIEKDVHAWGVPFLKDDKSTWNKISGVELALLDALGRVSENYAPVLDRKTCGNIFESVGKGIKS